MFDGGDASFFLRNPQRNGIEESWRQPEAHKPGKVALVLLPPQTQWNTFKCSSENIFGKGSFDAQTWGKCMLTSVDSSQSIWYCFSQWMRVCRIRPMPLVFLLGSQVHTEPQITAVANLKICRFCQFKLMPRYHHRLNFLESLKTNTLLNTCRFGQERC